MKGRWDSIDLPRHAYYDYYVTGQNVLVLATLNKGKIAEYREILQPYKKLVLKSLDEVVANAEAIKNIETADTYQKNALLKARAAFLAGKLPALSDDSGLEVDALEGRPGVLSARYGSAASGETKDAANIRKLLTELKGVPKKERTARFTCTTVFFSEGIVATATGTLDGSILEIPRGQNGFGYDPVFLVKGTDRSLAEIEASEKNRISHRARALQALLTELKDKGIDFAHFA
jgi:XTP/dITP diphosphohydrolase